VEDASELRFLAVYHDNDSGELYSYQLQLCRAFDIEQSALFLLCADVHAGNSPDVQVGGALDTSDLLERAFIYIKQASSCAGDNFLLSATLSA
jgi:hypothetical protein